MEGPLDRHNCATLDVNNDNIPDVLCGLGAVSGTQFGFNEVYVTNATDGSLQKAPQGHGLDKYPTMRNRFMKTLKGADGSDLVFLATKGVRREDGLENNHRMFRLVHPSSNSTTNNSTVYFEEVVPKPWARYTEASCVEVVDINQDGLDDIVVCNRKGRAMAFIQQADASWDRVIFQGGFAYDWRNVRIADMTGDGVNDVVVVGYGGLHSRFKPTSYVRIFRGLPEKPYFNLTSDGFFFGRSLPHASPDLELLDVNGDGHYDIYVVQVNQKDEGGYCSIRFNRTDWWTGGYLNFVPPLDDTPDLLLVSTPHLRRHFVAENMTHSEPGCGHFVTTFGDNRTMILAQGFRDRPGHNLLLKW